MSTLDCSITTIIEPRRRISAAGPAALWRYRELGWTLAMRDLSIRYKQTALGAAWAVIVPVTSMVVMHLFFGRVMGLADKTGGAAYPVFLFAGNLPWLLFSNTLNASSHSLVANAHILSKVYFPRLILPLSAAVAPAVDYLIALLVLLGLMAWFDVAVSARLLLLGPFALILLGASLGLSIALSAMMATYRDFRHAVPFLLQLLFFATPVVYPVSFVPAPYQWLAYLNPLAGTIEAMRAVVLGDPIGWSGLAVSGAASAAVLIGGILWFNGAERKFADVI